MTRCKFVCVSKREYLDGGHNVFEHQFSSVTTGQEDLSTAPQWFPPAALLTVVTRDASEFLVNEQYYVDIAPSAEIIAVAVAAMSAMPPSVKPL